MYPDTRCPASCVLSDHEIKRCIRAVGHSKMERHLWVGLPDKVGGCSRLVEWSVPDATEPELTGLVIVVSGERVTTLEEG